MNIDELKQKEKEIQEQIRTWEDFKITKRKYFAIPYPHLLEYSVYYETKVNEDNINQCKEKLNYFKIVSEYYENNDYIIDIECFIDGGKQIPKSIRTGSGIRVLLFVKTHQTHHVFSFKNFYPYTLVRTTA